LLRPGFVGALVGFLHQFVLVLPPFNLAEATMWEKISLAPAFARRLIVLCNITKGERLPIARGKPTRTDS
jgi:hypothetical protein